MKNLIIAIAALAAALYILAAEANAEEVTHPEKYPGAFVQNACFEFAEAYCHFNHGCRMVVVGHADRTTGHVLVLTPEAGLVDNFHPYPLYLDLGNTTPTEQLMAFYVFCGYEWGDNIFYGSIDYDHLTTESYAALNAMRAHQVPHEMHKALHY